MIRMESKEREFLLHDLSNNEICWFAARCALRAVPLLAFQGREFAFWKGHVSNNFSTIFRAINAGLFIGVNENSNLVTPLDKIFSDAQTASRAAYNSSFIAFLAARAGAFAVANSSFCAADAAAYCINAVAYTGAILEIGRAHV